MRPGPAISGGAHLALIVAALVAGEFSSRSEASPAAIAEVTLMTGTEFQAATSAAPDFDPNLPPAPAAPEPGEQRADVKVSETDAAPSTSAAPSNPDAPVQGEEVAPPQEEVVTAHVADVGEQLAAPAAPENDEVVAIAQPVDEIAPIAETPQLQAPPPAPRPNAPNMDTSSPAAPAPAPDPTPEPETVAEPEPVKPDPEPAPTPAPEVATPEPQPEPTPPEPPAPETERVKLNDPEIPAPLLAPPPPTKPRDLAEAAEATRLAREKAQPQPEETGATQQAEAPSGGGTTRTVGQVSFRDRESLRVGIKNYFSPPLGLQNERELAVKLQIELSQDGRITGGPKRVAGAGPAAGQRALEGAGVRALKRAEAAGVFRRLPSDKYAAWRLINVTFTPTELRIL